MAIFSDASALVLENTGSLTLTNDTVERLNYTDFNQDGTLSFSGFDTLYVQPENWSVNSPLVEVTAPAININWVNASEILKITTGGGVTVRGQNFKTAEEGLGLVSLGGYPETSNLELGTLRINGDLTIDQVESTQNIISVQAHKYSPSSNRPLSSLTADNIYVSQAKAGNAIIYGNGDNSKNLSYAVVSDGVIRISDSQAKSGIDLRYGSLEAVDGILLSNNTFSNYGIRLTQAAEETSRESSLEIATAGSKVVVSGSTVAGEGASFTGIAVDGAAISASATGKNKSYFFEVLNTKITADRAEVAGISLRNNSFTKFVPQKSHWLGLTVDGIELSADADITQKLIGVDLHNNAPSAGNNGVQFSGITVKNLGGEAMTGDVYGLTVGGNQRMQTVGSSVGFSLGNITVQNLVTKGDVYGVYADHEGKTQNVTDVNLDDLTVTRLVSAEGKTYGLYIAENTAVNVDGNMQLAADEGIYAENTEFNWGGNSAVILGNVIFNNVTANFDTDKSDGNDNAALIQGQVLLAKHTEFESESHLTVMAVGGADVETGYKDALVAIEGAKFRVKRMNSRNLDVTIASQESNQYEGAYSAEETDGVTKTVDYGALRAVSGGSINLSETANLKIYGNIIAGRGSNDESLDAGSITITNSPSARTLVRNVEIRGDVYAANGGTVAMLLDGESSVIEGQIDDYWELTSIKKGEVFRNAAFTDADGNALDITESGHVDLKLKDGAQWLARGQSFITDLTFEGDGSLVDLSRNTNSSVVIKNLKGDGTFRMKLGKPIVNETTGEVHSDMLYIQNMDNDAKYTIDVALEVNVNELNGLRFATTNTTSRLDNFVLAVNDQGFYNRTLTLQTEDYSVNDEDNKYFNGQDNGEGSYKPGETAVEELFGNQASTNWYFGDPEAFDPDSGNPDDPNPPGGDSSISDAGQAIIATARGLYYNAIEIDRFNQRYGDRRYDENNKSLWARVRHDRWGTDAGVGDFKSQNTTYQMGFDYTKVNEAGKMIYGVAVDLMDGNTDYESIDGSGETKRYAVSAYATYVGDNGSYLDVVGKVGRLSNEYSVRLASGARVSADYMNWMAGISVEAGHQLTSEGSRWFAEPQIQAQYVFVSDNDYSNGQTKIEQDNIHSFITRAGFRAGRWLGEGKNANVYFKTDVLHEWAGVQDIHVSDNTTAVKGDTFSINNHGTWFDVGLGFQAPMGKSFYAYGDAEYRFGNDLYQTWTFNLGGKYVF